MDTTLPNLFF